MNGAVFSVGDPHGSQGDSDWCGTAIQCSPTGTFQCVLHEKASLPGTPLADLRYPALEPPDVWLLHGFDCANCLPNSAPTRGTRSIPHRPFARPAHSRPR